MHPNSHVFEQNAPGNLLFDMVATVKFLLDGCSSLHILYENLVLPCYHFFVPVVERKSWFLLLLEVCTQIVIFLSLHILYNKNLVLPCYHFFVFVVEEKSWFFAVGGMHLNSPVFEQNAPQNLLFGMVATEKFLLVRCSSLNILYENLLLSCYHFFVPVVEEKSWFCCWRYAPK